MIKIQAYYMVMIHFLYQDLEQVASEYISIIYSLIDLKMEISEARMIEIYQDVGITLIKINCNNLQMTLNLFSKVIDGGNRLR